MPPSRPSFAYKYMGHHRMNWVATSKGWEEVGPTGNRSQFDEVAANTVVDGERGWVAQRCNDLNKMQIFIPAALKGVLKVRDTPKAPWRVLGPFF